LAKTRKAAASKASCRVLPIAVLLKNTHELLSPISMHGSLRYANHAENRTIPEHRGSRCLDHDVSRAAVDEVDNVVGTIRQTPAPDICVGAKPNPACGSIVNNATRQ
jgi:hypothetical protein